MLPRITTAEALEAWEQSAGRTPVESAMLLLSAAGEDPRPLTIGRFDARLLELHAEWFGPQLNAWLQCRECGEQLELDLPVRELLTRGEGESSPCVAELEHAGYAVRFRLPVVADAVAAARLSNENAAQRELLKRCVETVTRDGRPVPVEDMPEAVCAAIGHRMSEEDPMGDLVIDVTCPVCGAASSNVLDPASFVMGHVQRCATSILANVHELASRYGWAEQDILAMSPRRRAMYLELARS